MRKEKTSATYGNSSYSLKMILHSKKIYLLYLFQWKMVFILLKHSFISRLHWGSNWYVGTRIRRGPTLTEEFNSGSQGNHACATRCFLWETLQRNSSRGICVTVCTASVDQRHQVISVGEDPFCKLFTTTLYTHAMVKKTHNSCTFDKNAHAHILIPIKYTKTGSAARDVKFK